MTKYVHVFSGTEHEAAEGSLNWPWMPEEALEPDELERAREAARQHVADTLEAAQAEPAKRGPGQPSKAAAAEDAPDA